MKWKFNYNLYFQLSMVLLASCQVVVPLVLNNYFAQKNSFLFQLISLNQKAFSSCQMNFLILQTTIIRPLLPPPLLHHNIHRRILLLPLRLIVLELLLYSLQPPNLEYLQHRQEGFLCSHEGPMDEHLRNDRSCRQHFTRRTILPQQQLAFQPISTQQLQLTV